jgi:SAM-dependent methyltransferase
MRVRLRWTAAGGLHGRVYLGPANSRSEMGGMPYRTNAPASHDRAGRPRREIGLETGIDAGSSAEFFVRAMRELGAASDDATLRVLDFGCGQGDFVRALNELGLEAQGCDFQSRLGPSAALHPIDPDPYRLPFDDDSFDFVLSTNVLEHAQNVETCYREIRRVLKTGGKAMHVFPSKWYLPTEPHIWVPLMNWVWPRRPRWWLTLWALLGVRKVSQRGMPWRVVVDDNDAYLRDHCSYLSSSRHHQVSVRVFGNAAWPMSFYIEHSPGGVGRLGRRLPLRRIYGWVARELRVSFLVQTKVTRPPE